MKMPTNFGWLFVSHFYWLENTKGVIFVENQI
jgi:hypothetical protein